MMGNAECLHDVPGSGKISSTMGNAQPSPKFAQDRSEETKQHSLESNPENPLEKIEAAKYAK
ncbi:unnamed protein product [Penicillium manginii]